MVIIFPPFHFPLLPSSPPPLHLLLQAINLSYMCHPVHVCVVRVHTRRAYAGMYIMCGSWLCSRGEHADMFDVWCFFFSFKYFACTPKSLCDLKKEHENTMYRYVPESVPPRDTSPYHVAYTACLHPRDTQTHTVHTHYKGLSHSTSCTLRTSCYSSSLVYIYIYMIILRTGAIM